MAHPASNVMNERDEYEEMVTVLQLDGVLDFDAIRRAVNSGSIRVRECNTETPMVQIGSHLYSGQWTQTLGTDLLLCPCPIMSDCHHRLDAQQRLELVAVSDTRLCAQKVLLATDENPLSGNDTQKEQSSSNVQ